MKLIRTNKKTECEAIARRIHYKHMKDQHDMFVPAVYTDEQVKALFEEHGFEPSDIFPNLTEAEAIEQYAIVGMKNGELTLDGGHTKKYAEPRKTVNDKWTIPVPNDFMDIDFDGFNYAVIEYSKDLFPEQDIE